MTIIKLQNAGESLTMAVAGCEEVEGQFGKQVKFTADNGDVLYLPQSSADNQLERIGLTYADAIGNRLTFSRDPNKKPGAKPYWSINVAGPAAAPSKRLPPPATPAPERVPPRQGAAPKPLPFDEEIPLPPDPDEPAPYREPAEPAPVPRETADVALKVRKRHDFLNLYAATFNTLAGLLPTDDPQALQAATATCIIQMDRKGLLP